MAVGSVEQYYAVCKHAARGDSGARSEAASVGCASMRVLAARFIVLRLNTLRVALYSYYARSMSPRDTQCESLPFRIMFL